MTNSEIIQNCFDFLKQNHLIYKKEFQKKFEKYNPDVFSEISFNNIESFVANTKWNELNDPQFEYNLRCLIALFKDAHTDVKYEKTPCYINHLNGTLCYNVRFIVLADGIYLYDNKEYFKVEKINKCNIDKIVKNIYPILNFEIDERKKFLLQTRLNEVRTFEMLGFEHPETLKISVVNKEGAKQTIQTSAHSIEELNSNPYSFFIKNKILYLKSTACGARGFDFDKVINQIKLEYNNKNFSYYIYDIRDNRGGNNNNMKEWHEFVKKNRLQGVTIVNNGTFSAGIWEAVSMKDKNTYLIGENIGQPICRFGNCSKFLKTERFTLRCSTTFFEKDEDSNELYKNKPFIKNNRLVLDYYVSNTIDDLINHRDVPLEVAFDYLYNTKVKE